MSILSKHYLSEQLVGKGQENINHSKNYGPIKNLILSRKMTRTNDGPKNFGPFELFRLKMLHFQKLNYF